MVFLKKRYPYFYNGSYKQLLEIVLSRFTIAKIASKVPAISPTEYMKIFDKSGIDLTKYNGLYAHMTGFGGICQMDGKERSNRKK